MGKYQSVRLFRRAPDVNTALVLDACANPDIYFSKTHVFLVCILACASSQVFKPAGLLKFGVNLLSDSTPSEVLSREKKWLK